MREISNYRFQISNQEAWDGLPAWCEMWVLYGMAVWCEMMVNVSRQGFLWNLEFEI
jgi:hypothetical protein